MKFRTLAILFLCLVTFSVKGAFATPEKFYTSLIQGITSAKGHAIIDFIPGEYRSKVTRGGTVTKVRWLFRANSEGDIRFDYKNDSLKEATLVFNPPVRVWLESAGGYSASITMLKYDGNGGIIDWGLERSGTNAPTGNPNSIPELQRHLRMSDEVEDLLIADRPSAPLSSDTSIRPIQPDGTNDGSPRSMIERIKFKPASFPTPEGDYPSLDIEFRSGANIDFSKQDPRNPQGYNNKVVLNPGSEVKFGNITYNVQESYVRGFINQVSFKIQKGHLNTKGFNLELTNGSDLDFPRIYIDTRDPETGEAIIDGKRGDLSASLKDGSRLVVQKQNGTGTGELVFKNSSSLDVDDLELHIGENNSASFRFAGTTSADFFIQSGVLPFGADGYLLLDDGQCKFDNLHGIWTARNGLNVSGKITLLDLVLKGGEVYPNSVSKLTLTGGKVEATDLNLSSEGTPAVTGLFTTVELKVDSGSKLGVEDGIEMVTETGIIAAKPRSLRLMTDRKYPVGVIQISDLGIRNFYNHARKSFNFKGGTLNMTLEVKENGSTSSPYDQISADGTPNFKTEDAISFVNTQFSAATLGDTGGVADFSISLALTDAFVWPKTIGRPRKVTGVWAGTYNSFFWPLVTEAKGMDHQWDFDNDGQPNDDARLYPVRMNLTLNAAAGGNRFGPTPITLEGTNVRTSFSINPTFTASVLNGGGQYRVDDNPAAGTEGGTFSNSQEIFRDHVVISDVHLYLHPKVYQLTCKFEVGHDNEGLFVDISRIDINPAIEKGSGWDKDGGDLPFIGAIVGSLLGGLPGAIAGNIGGEITETKLEKLINGKIAEKMVGYNRQWRAQTF